MEPRFQVVRTSENRGYILDTLNAKKMSADMSLEKAAQLAENFNFIDKMKGAK